MTRIAKRFVQLKSQGRKGFIAYVTAGLPDVATTIEAVQALEEAGADVIELGIPFSDPMADGPVIQKAATVAIEAGITTPKVLELVRSIRKTSQIPLVVMTYINTILNVGSEKFVRSFADAGLDGIIQVFPFNCMPEIIAKNILPQVSKEVNMPVISLAFDEQSGEAGVLTRLEAFIDLLEYRRSKKYIAK